MPGIPEQRPEFYDGLGEALIAFAEATFRLEARNKEDHSHREELEGLLARARTDERRAEIEAELAVPPFPRELGFLWQAFLRLSSRRGSTAFGPAAITWPDIDAFTRLSGLRLAAWEIELIEQLDELWLRQGSVSSIE